MTGRQPWRGKALCSETTAGVAPFAVYRHGDEGGPPSELQDQIYEYARGDNGAFVGGVSLGFPVGVSLGRERFPDSALCDAVAENSACASRGSTAPMRVREASPTGRATPVEKFGGSAGSTGDFPDRRCHRARTKAEERMVLWRGSMVKTPCGEAGTWERRQSVREAPSVRLERHGTRGVSWVSVGVSLGRERLPRTPRCAVRRGEHGLRRGAEARRRQEAPEESSARCAMLEEKFGGSRGISPFDHGRRARARPRNAWCSAWVGEGGTPRGTMIRRNRVRWVFLVGG